MGKSGIYCRQSLDKKDSLSIEAQTEKCASLCVYKGKEYKTYTDKGFSGKNMQRPAFEQMIADIEAGEIDEVVVYRLDRISRNLNDFTSMVDKLDKLGVTFASATESFDNSTPMGRAMMSLLMVFAQLERESIAERIKDNAMYRASLGRWTGGVVPFGYDKIRIDENGINKAKLIINEDEAEKVRQFFEWYIESPTLRGLVVKANKLNMLTRDNCYWSTGSMTRILHNPIYATNTKEVFDYFVKKNDQTIYNDYEEFDGSHGMMYYRVRQEVVKKRLGMKTQEQFIIIGEHAGIISGELWTRVNKIMDTKKFDYDRVLGKKNYFLLECITKCRCGSATTFHYSNTKRHKHIYIKCKKRQEQGTFLCDNVSHNYLNIERQVLSYVMEVCKDDKKLALLLEKADEKENINLSDSKKDLKKIEKAIAAKENKIENLIKSLELTVSDLIMKKVENNIKSLSKEIEALQSDLSAKKDMLNYCEDRKINKQFAIDNMRKFPKLFEAANNDIDKQKIIRGIIKRIKIWHGEIDIEFFI